MDCNSRPPSHQSANFPPLIQSSRNPRQISRCILCSKRIQQGRECQAQSNQERESQERWDLGRANDRISLYKHSDCLVGDLTLRSRHLEVCFVRSVDGRRIVQPRRSCCGGGGAVHDVYSSTRLRANDVGTTYGAAPPSNQPRENILEEFAYSKLSPFVHPIYFESTTSPSRFVSPNRLQSGNIRRSYPQQ